MTRATLRRSTAFSSHSVEGGSHGWRVDAQVPEEDFSYQAVVADIVAELRIIARCDEDIFGFVALREIPT